MSAIVRYAPPAVRYPFARSVVITAFSLVVSAMSAFGLVAFTMVLEEAGAGMQPLGVFAWVSWALASLTSRLYLLRTPSGVLVWDGRVWSVHFTDRRAPVLLLRFPPQVLVDMQAWLWVTVVHDDLYRSWIWLERSRKPERWGDLRRAVYSPAMQAASPASLSHPAPGREP